MSGGFGDKGGGGSDELQTVRATEDEAQRGQQPGPIPRYDVVQVFLREAQTTEALHRIMRCCEVSLTQGPLSKRNALIEIEDIARRAVAP